MFLTESRVMKKRYKFLIIIVILIAIFLFVCRPRLSITELDGDIVFVSEPQKRHFQLHTYDIADNEVKSVDVSRLFFFPTVDLINNRFICLIQYGSTPGSYREYGSLVKAEHKMGKLKACGRYPESIQLDPRENNEDYVIITSFMDVEIFNMATCETVELLYSWRKGTELEEDKRYIDRVSMSRDGKYLYLGKIGNAFRPADSIVQLNLITRERVSLVDGSRPSISPDGNRLAFIDNDTLKILDIDTRAVIDFDKSNFLKQYHFSTVDWDESGSKLLVEMYYGNENERTYRIFILDVYSGNVTAISTPGMQASWIRK